MTARNTFANAPSSFNFPKTESEILHYWDEIDAFRKSLEISKDRKPFSFYDGPPFATGHPHYGHILAGTIKDVVTRFATQTGHYVERRFGWDTHGLPVEFEIDKKLGIKSREDVLKMGVAKYNAACREIVMRYSKEWERVVARCGRWIDFENDYKTLDLSFMESVWSVFKTACDKGLIYRGFKIMPYSTSLGTALSNFEANLNYKDVSDPSVIVKFNRKNKPGEFFLAWTTTPWTLPSNLALCVKPSMKYLKIRDVDSGESWFIATSRLCELYKKPRLGKNYVVLEKLTGADLKGQEYVPLFDYFQEKYASKGAFRILTDEYVTEKCGTGIVHQAPGFGEDDYRVCLGNGVISKNDDVLCPIGPNGHFETSVAKFEGLYVKDADAPILKDLKNRGLLARRNQYVHSYPFCWRSDCPLIYRSIPSWFLNVERIKERLVANTQQTNWVPDHVKQHRFMSWIQDARDWAISRSRFWGTPIPVWSSEDFSELVVIGSIKELEELSGVKGIKDLHKESVDDIEIRSKKTGKILRRVEDVFDCWFESGSMPYAQAHYPFENEKKFEESFPADFVAEGLDQTRGWFYTLMVISTVMFDKPAFKNLICNGLVLAEDGKKMSKRLKNYPPPMEVVEKYGADALRIYLINSPVVKAENLRFSEKGVNDVIKEVFLLWYNTYRFFVENASRYESETKRKFNFNAEVWKETENLLDKWIFSKLQSLISNVRKSMAEYKLYEVTPKLVNFLGQLSLWYVRFNRERMKGSQGSKEALSALQTLCICLFDLCRLMAPFTPFIAEKLYQNLKLCLPEGSLLRADSVHFLILPDAVVEATDPKIERAIARLQAVIESGRKIREKCSLMIKQPLRELKIVNSEEEFLEDVKEFDHFIKSELSLKEVSYSKNLGEFVSFKCEPNLAVLGRRLKKKAAHVFSALNKITDGEIKDLRDGEKILVGGEEIGPDDVLVKMQFKESNAYLKGRPCAGGCVVLDTELTEDLKEEYLSREFSSTVQKLKKKLNLTPDIKINVFYQGGSKIEKVVQRFENQIRAQTGNAVHPLRLYDNHQRGVSLQIGNEESEIGGEGLKLLVVKKQVAFSKCLLDRSKQDERLKALVSFIVSKDYSDFAAAAKDGSFQITIDGEKHVLSLGKDYFLNFETLKED